MKENKMKPRRTHKHTGPQWTGKDINTGDKTTSRPSYYQLKPFAGKVFYLDLPSNKTAETLECDIKQLGGSVEKFFSKEIKYLVSNKKEAQYVQFLRQDSPVPSPNSGQSSPQTHSNPHHPVSHKGKINSRFQGQTDALVTSRGKSLVEKVVKEQERVKMNKILSNALEWGVKILYVDDVIAYVHKKKKLVNRRCPVSTSIKTSVKAEPAAGQGLRKCKGGRISKPFIKVEDSSRHYRPIYLSMPHMPEFNLQSVPPCSPFCVPDKYPPGNKQLPHRGTKASASEERADVQKKNRDKRRAGYCECCMIKYENLKSHLHSERHQGFSKSDNYFVVDRLVSAMHCSFIHIQATGKRPKCNVSSVLVAPGPCGKVELSHMGDIDNNESNKQERQWTVTGEEGSSSRHALKNKSSSASAAFICTEGDGKNCCTDWETSKHESIPLKQPWRNNSLTFCYEKAEQAQQVQLKTQKASCSGECPAPPTMVTQADLMDQIALKDVSSLTPVPHDMNLESEKEERRFPTQSFSPVRKISRRIRVYKRKRRRISTHLEHLKQSPDNSMLKLGELFQSSDDMDEEFYGF